MVRSVPCFLFHASFPITPNSWAVHGTNHSNIHQTYNICVTGHSDTDNSCLFLYTALDVWWRHCSRSDHQAPCAHHRVIVRSTTLCQLSGCRQNGSCYIAQPDTPGLLLYPVIPEYWLTPSNNWWLDPLLFVPVILRRWMLVSSPRCSSELFGNSAGFSKMATGDVWSYTIGWRRRIKWCPRTE